MTFVQRILALALVGFFAFGLFAYGGSMTESHHIMGDGTSHHVCPLMGTTPGCVNIIEHLSHWQSSFIAVFVEAISILTLFVAVCACLWFLRQQVGELLGLLKVSRSPPVLSRQLLQRHTLQEAFSNGLVHSKAY